MSENPPNANPRVRAALGAGLIVLLLVGAVIAVAVFWSPGAAARPVAVYAVSENDALLVSLQSAAAGERSTSEQGGATSEALRWQALDPAVGAVLLDGTPRLLAMADLSLGAINEVRLSFLEVVWLDGSQAHTLHLPDTELHLRLPASGAPGDALLLVFDGDESIVVEGGVFAFRAKVSESAWTPGAASAGQAPERPVRTPTLPPPPAARPTPVVTQPAASNGAAAPQPPPNVGHLNVRFAGDGMGLVERLDAQLAKFGLAEERDHDKVMTRYQGAVWVDLAAAGEEGVAMLRLQLPIATYGAVHMEWGGAATELATGAEFNATVPQPALAVFSPFNVTRGGETTITLTFGLEQSLFIGPDGLEFRPVVTEFRADDEDGRGPLDPYPRQQRSGEDWLPELGSAVDDALGEAGVNPEDLADPEALRPDEVDPESLAGELLGAFLDELGEPLPGIPIAAI